MHDKQVDGQAVQINLGYETPGKVLLVVLFVGAVLGVGGVVIYEKVPSGHC